MTSKLALFPKNQTEGSRWSQRLELRWSQRDYVVSGHDVAVVLRAHCSHGYVPRHHVSMHEGEVHEALPLAEGLGLRRRHHRGIVGTQGFGRREGMQDESAGNIIDT